MKLIAGYTHCDIFLKLSQLCLTEYCIKCLLIDTSIVSSVKLNIVDGKSRMKFGHALFTVMLLGKVMLQILLFYL